MKAACLTMALALCLSAPAFAAKHARKPAAAPQPELPALIPPDLSGSDTRWIHDAKSDCWAWYPDDPVDMTFTWTGRCKAHVLDGQGTLVWFRGSDVERTIDGLFRLGRGNGPGTIRYSGGDTYEGNLRNGLKEGQGTAVYVGTGRYRGAFHKNWCEGQGVQTLSNGDTIAGTFRLSRPTGAVVFRSAAGATFNGEIVLPHNDPSLPVPSVTYPELSMRFNEQGTAVVSSVVGKDGTQRDVHIVVSTGVARLDDAAVAYVTALHVVAGTVGGEAVDMGYDRRVVFHIPQ